MFINEGDEIDKIYLPAHSNHRHNVHKQLCCICTRCYRGVTHQGQHVVLYTGGGFTPGAKVIILPRNSPDARGKKILDRLHGMAGL